MDTTLENNVKEYIEMCLHGTKGSEKSYLQSRILTWMEENTIAQIVAPGAKLAFNVKLLKNGQTVSSIHTQKVRLVVNIFQFDSLQDEWRDNIANI